MVQFRVEFDRDVDQSITVPGMLMAIQSHLDAMPNCGHGLPLGSSLTNINWYPELDRWQRQRATMVFTLDNETRGAAATIASLLCCTHSRLDHTLLAIPITSPRHGQSVLGCHHLN